MPQLVTEIILVDQDYGLACGEDKAQAVVEYVNGLARRYFRFDELPPNAVRSYYADYYTAQVQNGNIHQFVHNSRWNPVIVESVSAALDAMGIVQQAALFAEVRNFIERDRPRLEAYPAGRYCTPATRPYMDDLANIGGGFSARFRAHPNGPEAGERQIAVANAAWISSWPEVKWVTADQFDKELDRLATVIADLPTRMQRAKENRPWPYKRIDEVLAGAGQTLVRATGVEREATAAGVTGMLWHIITDHGHQRVMFANREAILLLGDRDEAVARVPAPEAG
jgi:hypothetical protein